jgi:dipeptidyl aminopeptidase/acylaminoacyl peptidase
MTRLVTRLALAVTLAAVASAAGRRPISETDLFDFRWVADPQISPDGTRVAFVRVSVDSKADRYDTALWIVAANGAEPARQLTAGPRDLAPRWSPDGRRLAFLRAAEKGGKPEPTQIHLISLDGGEAATLTDLPRGAGAPEWSPDGRSLVFAATANEEDLRKAERRKPEEKEGSKEAPPRESDVRVITRAVYRFNGAGYLDPKRPAHLWTVAVPEKQGEIAKPKQLTSGRFAETSPAWSPDGTRIFFLSNRTVEPYYDLPDADLYATPAAGGEMVKVASIDGAIGNYAVSPDGRRVAFVGSANRPVHSYNQPDLWIADAAPGAAPKNLTASYDFDIGGGIGSDQHAPRGGLPGGPVWNRDGRWLTVVVARHGRANLERVDAATGKVEPLTRGDQDLISYTATADGSKLAAVISTPASIGDLWLVDGAGGGARQLTRVNDDLFSKLDLGAIEEFWYTSFDGKKVQAWLQKPPGFDPAKKYPMILEIHGGPHSAYGYTFTHEFHWMAAKGYLVLYTNPRGSTSYGQEFGNVIQYRYPGDDYRDLMIGVDEALKRGFVDPVRLGVTGGSGGGLLTNWVVTQTTRFAAAVSQRSISDWAAFWGTADFTLFQATWFRGAPWEEPADFAARSPLAHVAKVTTPLMFIEGEADYRTPPGAGGEAMFRALKYLRKPTAMVRFPDESHELSRSGKPWHRVERLQHILNWFDKYLQGKSIKLYDVD